MSISLIHQPLEGLLNGPMYKVVTAQEWRLFMGLTTWTDQEFPGSPVVRIQCFHCWGPGSIPGQGTKILQAAQLGQKTNKQNHNNKNMDWPSYCYWWVPTWPTAKTKTGSSIKLHSPGDKPATRCRLMAVDPHIMKEAEICPHWNGYVFGYGFAFPVCKCFCKYQHLCTFRMLYWPSLAFHTTSLLVKELISQPKKCSMEFTTLVVHTITQKQLA